MIKTLNQFVETNQYVEKIERLFKHDDFCVFTEDFSAEYIVELTNKDLRIVLEDNTVDIFLVNYEGDILSDNTELELSEQYDAHVELRDAYADIIDFINEVRSYNN